MIDFNSAKDVCLKTEDFIDKFEEISNSPDINSSRTWRGRVNPMNPVNNSCSTVVPERVPVIYVLLDVHICDQRAADA